MSDRLKGLVAAILTSREIVMNIGTDDGVEVGMRFVVLNTKGIEIKDPASGQLIGSVEVPKVSVEVVRTQPSLSIARTFRKIERNVGGAFPSTAALFQPAKWVETYETLRSNERPSVEELDEEESYVKIGDPVVQVEGNEYSIEGL